jgi:hypothetical protein
MNVETEAENIFTAMSGVFATKIMSPRMIACFECHVV